MIEIRGVRIPDDAGAIPDRIAGIMRSGDYERPELDAIERLVQPGDHVLDIGAGFGVTGTLAAKRAGPGRVVSVEANPKILPHLRSVHRENDVRLTLAHGVLTHDPDLPKHRFHARPLVWGSSLFETGVSGEEVDVPSLDFDSVFHDLSPDVILCDIEGAEIGLFDGRQLPGVGAVVVEYHPKVTGRRAVERVDRHFRSLGFRRIRALCEGDVVAYRRRPWSGGWRWGFGR